MADDRRAVAAVRRLDQAEAAGRAARSDPYLAGGLGRSAFAENGPRLETGVVLDVVPAEHRYQVSAGRNSLLWCTSAGLGAAFGVLGARPLSTYPVGTVVFFVRHPESPEFGYILGSVPHWSTHTANQPADGVWPFTRSGQFVEPAHQYPNLVSAALAGSTPTNLGSVEGADFAAGRPHDATSVGEWGAVFETGVGVFADPFQAYLRVDESTGVFAFYDDQVLRLAGHNLQVFSSVCESERLEDEGELSGWDRECVFAWEPVGLWRYNQVTPGWVSPAVTSHGLAPGQGSLFNNPYEATAGSGEAVREPEFANQIPAARIHRWAGYLGQGGHSVVAGPAQLDWAYPGVPSSARDAVVAGVVRPDAPSGRLSVNGTQTAGAQPYAVPPNTRGGPDQPGVFEQSTTLTGAYHLRSARRVLISKRCSIPTPRPVKRPEDPGGDRPASGYKAGGLGPTPAAPAHKVTADAAAGKPAAHRAVLLPDVIAYAFNWENLHPFAYHEQDWSAAEEGQAGSDAVNQQEPEFGDLALQQYLDTPDPIYLDVDHRYGLSPYYETESGVALLDDGTVVIYDGWGSEIRMGGGNIEFRCSGDVASYPGRNFAVWAGHDVDVKAHDTVDLAAVNGDMFHRAQFKYHAVSGNGGCGGFLFENKAECAAFDFDGKVGADVVSSGFVVLCPTSAFVVEAQDVTVRLADDAPQDARIFLDAGNSRHVHTRSKTFVNRISANGSVVHLFDGTSGPSANEFAEDYALVGTDLNVYGSAFVTNCLSVGESVVAGGHVQTAGAAGASYLVAASSFDPEPYQIDVEDRVLYLVGDFGTAFLDQEPTPPGFDDAEFTHRNSAQYRTTDFVYWESRWQTMAAGQTLWVWSEPSVVGLRSGAETHAYPGERRLDDDTYAAVVPTFADTDDGWKAVPRGASRAAYEAAATNDPDYTAIDSSYKVTTPPCE